jgi:hypothetical protein
VIPILKPGKDPNEEPTQIMGYADDWVVMTSNKAPLLADGRKQA